MRACKCGCPEDAHGFNAYQKWVEGKRGKAGYYLPSRYRVCWNCKECWRFRERKK